MAASAIVPGDSGGEKGDGKLSLRMKLVTPVDEVSSDRFSLQSKSQAAVLPWLHPDYGDAMSSFPFLFFFPEPSLPEEDGAAVKESTVASVVTR